MTYILSQPEKLSRPNYWATLSSAVIASIDVTKKPEEWKQSRLEGLVRGWYACFRDNKEQMQAHFSKEHITQIRDYAGESPLTDGQWAKFEAAIKTVFAEKE